MLFNDEKEIADLEMHPDEHGGIIFDNILFPIDKYDIDIPSIEDRILLGPQSEILEHLEDFNDKYNTYQSWSHRNGAQLETISEPLEITKKYRWKSGSKEKLKAMIGNYVNRNHRKGHMKSLFRYIEDGGLHRTRNMGRDFNTINDLMSEMRNNGFVFAENTEAITAKYTEIQSVQTLIDEANKINPDFKFYISVTRNSYDDCIASDEVDNFTNARVNIFMVWENHTIKYTNMDHEVIGEIPMGTLYVNFNMQYDKWLNAQANYDGKVIPYSFNHSRGRANKLFVTMHGAHLHPDMGNDYQRRKIFQHPFISNSRSYYTGDRHPKILFNDKDYGNNPNANWLQLHYMCLGNQESCIRQAAVNLDFKAMIMMFQQWSYYYVQGTNPLNNIRYSFLGMPSKYGEDFSTRVAKDTDTCGNESFRHAQIQILESKVSLEKQAESFGEYPTINYWHHLSTDYSPDDYVQEEDWRILKERELEDKYGTLFEVYSKMKGNCDEMECSLRSNCMAYTEISEYIYAHSDFKPPEIEPEPEVEEEEEIQLGNESEIRDAIVEEMTHWYYAQTGRERRVNNE